MTHKIGDLVRVDNILWNGVWAVYEVFVCVCEECISDTFL